MNLLEVDATSYDDYTSVGNKFIAILRMAERNKILENRTSKISTLDLQTSIAKTSKEEMCPSASAIPGLRKNLSV